MLLLLLVLVTGLSSQLSKVPPALSPKFFQHGAQAKFGVRFKSGI